MTLPTLRCSIPSQKEKKETKKKIKGKRRKLGQQEWKLTAKELLKPLHLTKNRMLLQSLLAHYLHSIVINEKWMFVKFLQ